MSLDAQDGRTMTEIREITREEAATVAGLLGLGFRDVAERFDFTFERCPTFPAYITAERIAYEAGAGTRFFVIGERGEARGCVGLKIEDGRCWMVRLAVAPQYRHLGVGRALVEYAEGEARRAGFGRVDIAVVGENRVLCAWYEMLGYRACETKRFDHLPFTVVYMFRDVGPWSNID